MPPKSTQYKEAGTKDAVTDVPKLSRSASRWKKKDLELLGVEYQYDRFDDIRIDVEEREMPSELLEGEKRLTTDGLICSY